MRKEHPGKLIIVSNRLPYYKTMSTGGEARWEKSPGGLVNALDPILKEKNGLWIGWDGTFSGHSSREQTEEIHNVAHLGFSGTKKSYKILSVPLSKKEVEQYYTNFSNNTLWGLFHYFFEKSSIDYSSWEAYKNINKRFASYINKVAGEKDIIWINDFHLFLCPFFLRRINPKYQIHFFLHIPFPHVDIFSTLPWGKDILNSLACCNSIGFQHRQHMKNYLGAVHALLGPKKDKASYKRLPFAFVNPIGIDFKKYDSASRKSNVIKRKKGLMKQNHYVKMILGVDRLDYSKGIKQKMLGIENLLETYPGLAGEFCFYQLAVPSREAVSAYRLLKKDVDEIVGRINGRFSTGIWHPIQYMYSKVDFDALVALYSAADIALITPLRDGMNLVSKEYVASHSDEEGILILSKFAGASAELRNAISVNPYSIEDISGALLKAFTMPPGAIKTRMQRMRANVRTNDIHAWLNKSLSVFERTKKEGKRV